MPIAHVLWKVGSRPERVATAKLAEKEIEDMIVAQPEILSSDWMLIGRQENDAAWRDHRSARCRAGRVVGIDRSQTCTLDYLARRLRQCYPAERVLTLFGAGGPEGMNELDRENVKAAFNSPASPVRILVATDAASEGLNLHRTARYLPHYDCPWNPSRLEQRNGRLDRYGQARDVTVYHFISDTDQDVRFLGHVVHKADEIREDLGSGYSQRYQSWSDCRASSRSGRGQMSIPSGLRMRLEPV